MNKMQQIMRIDQREIFSSLNVKSEWLSVCWTEVSLHMQAYKFVQNI